MMRAAAVLLLVGCICEVTACRALPRDAVNDCRQSSPECDCTSIQVSKAAMEDFCQDPGYIVTSPPATFLMEPQSGIYSSVTQLITLNCSISTVGESPIVWEHEGRELNDDSIYITNQSPTFSALKIAGKFSSHYEGEYRCKVKNGNQTVVSQPAKLKLPRFFGWIDEVYPPQPASNHTRLTISNGGSVVLECHPNTTDTIQHILWLQDGKLLDVSSTDNHYQLPDGSLLVRNVLLSEMKTMNYTCIIVLLHVLGQPSRTFTISTSKEPTVSRPINFTVTPKTMAVVQGDSISLYCIAEGNPMPTISWYKDGTPVSELSSSQTRIEDKGEVLLLGSIALETSGNYTCSAVNLHHSATSSAYVTVVAPPTSASISVSGGGSYMYNSSDAFVPIHSDTINLTLACTIDESSMALSWEFRWAFRGEATGLQMFVPEGNLLHISVRNPWDVIGTFQCFASSITGAVSATVRVLPQGKPNPPSQLGVTRDSGWPFVYVFYWDSPRPQIGDKPVNNYTIEVLIPERETLCSCVVDHDYLELYFLATAYYDCTLYFRIAANTDLAQSDFRAYDCRTDTAPYVSLVAPPPPVLRLPQMVAVPQERLWNVTLSWYTDECKYPSYFYDLSVKINCDGMETRRHQFQPSSAKEYHLTLPCCASCRWNITLDTRESISHSSDTFVTPPLLPSEPAVLNSVSRVNSDGKSITADFTLPLNNISCHPTCIIIRFSNSTFSDNSTAPLEYDPAKRNYTVEPVLDNAVCWEQYNISVAYRNSKGDSAFSNMLTLRGALQDDATGFTSVRPEVHNSTAISIHWQLGGGTVCLLHMGVVSGKVCYAKKELNRECKDTVLSNCSSIFSNGAQLTFSGLHPYQNYCFAATIQASTDNLSIRMNTTIVTAQTKEGKPGRSPQNLTLVPSSNEIIVTWNPPPRESWNGILRAYSVTVSNTSRSWSVTKNISDENVHRIKPYNSSLQYTVSLSACTRMGCGPAYTAQTEIPTEVTHGTSDSTTPSTQASSQGGTLVIQIVVPITVVALVIIFVVAVVVLTKKFNCFKKQETDIEDREPLPRGEIIDEPLRGDDLVSVGGHVPSVHSDHTSYNPIMRRFLDDLPDGDEEHPEVLEQENEQLMGSPNARSKIARKLNYPPRPGLSPIPENASHVPGERVEMESIDPDEITDNATDHTSETQPLVPAGKKHKHKKNRSEELTKANKSKEHKLKKPQRKETAPASNDTLPACPFPIPPSQQKHAPQQQISKPTFCATTGYVAHPESEPAVFHSGSQKSSLELQLPVLDSVATDSSHHSLSRPRPHLHPHPSFTAGFHNTPPPEHSTVLTHTSYGMAAMRHDAPWNPQRAQLPLQSNHPPITNTGYVSEAMPLESTPITFKPPAHTIPRSMQQKDSTLNASGYVKGPHLSSDSLNQFPMQSDRPCLLPVTSTGYVSEATPLESTPTTFEGKPPAHNTPSSMQQKDSTLNALGYMKGPHLSSDSLNQFPIQSDRPCLLPVTSTGYVSEATPLESTPTTFECKPPAHNTPSSMQQKDSTLNASGYMKGPHFSSDSLNQFPQEDDDIPLIFDSSMGPLTSDFQPPSATTKSQEYTHFGGNLSTSTSIQTNPPQPQPPFDLCALTELVSSECDDAASIASSQGSVFEEAITSSSFQSPTQRTRSEMTSGVFSQSDSVDLDIPPSENATSVSEASSTAPTLTRTESEGYYSQPHTPLVKRRIKFSNEYVTEPLAHGDSHFAVESFEASTTAPTTEPNLSVFPPAKSLNRSSYITSDFSSSGSSSGIAHNSTDYYSTPSSSFAPSLPRQSSKRETYTSSTSQPAKQKEIPRDIAKQRHSTSATKGSVSPYVTTSHGVQHTASCLQRSVDTPKAPQKSKECHLDATDSRGPSMLSFLYSRGSPVTSCKPLSLPATEQQSITPEETGLGGVMSISTVKNSNPYISAPLSPISDTHSCSSGSACAHPTISPRSTGPSEQPQAYTGASPPKYIIPSLLSLSQSSPSTITNRDPMAESQTPCHRQSDVCENKSGPYMETQGKLYESLAELPSDETRGSEGLRSDYLPRWNQNEMHVYENTAGIDVNNFVYELGEQT